MEQLPLELQAAEMATGEDGAAQKLDRAVQIGRHYRWTQLARRGVNVLQQRRAGDRPIGEIAVPDQISIRSDDNFRRVAAIVTRSYQNHGSHSQGDLPAGRLVLLREAVDLGWPIQWKLSQQNDLSHLWRFQLQYHEYLMSFLADQDAVNDPQNPAWQTIWQFLGTWVHQHDPVAVRVSADAWHPYCISRRAVVWVWLLSLGEPPAELQSTVVRSLYQQLEYLHDHLEFDLRGNHLFENLTALAITGSFLDTGQSAKWLATARRGLRRELPEQVLDHGEHFELSPMYHCQILGNVLKMAGLTSEAAPEISEQCLDYARRMWDFLQHILHPDGEIPLFGDSGFGEAPDVSQLKALADTAGFPESTPSGPIVGHYWVARPDDKQDKQSDFLIFDFGPVGADGLPAHAHCDLLNIEASVEGRRWIVDSGNFDYRDGSMRHFCRSSIAHNVMTVGGQNQCDVWSKFRMGRRGRVLQSKSGRTGDVIWSMAAHDGYRRHGIPRLSRLVAAAADPRAWICVDFAPGNKSVELAAYLHIAPGILVESTGKNQLHQPEFVLDDGRARRRLGFFGTANVEIMEGWYCPAFGYREKNTVIVYRQSGARSQPLGWLLQPEPVTCQLNRVAETQQTPSLRLELPQQTFEWTFD
ncbi:MAG: heparinase II/III domain-containing protein [Pirellulaceae bacterium]